MGAWRDPQAPGPLRAAAVRGDCGGGRRGAGSALGGSIELIDQTPGLFVRGTTCADTLEGGDAEIHIGDGRFTHLVYGEYNHGTLAAGRVETPWVVDYDHDLRVTAAGGYLVDNYGTSDRADFNRSNIAESFVPEVVDPEYGRIIVEEFLRRLRAGLPVLLPGRGAQPHRP